jgi:predicted nucleic acid-binding protein
MKVIVDSCVWSLALRRRNVALLGAEERKLVAELRDLIQDDRAVLLGLIRQEILSGIRDKAEFSRIQDLLDPFLNEAMQTNDYIEAAKLFNLCQSHGVQCGAVDILICAVAARNQLGILTSDQGLKRCVEALRAEGLNL